MRYLIFIFSLSCINILGAQNEGRNPEAKAKMLEKLEAQRVAFITNKLELTPDESAKFWPLYNEYSKKRQELRKERINSRQSDSDDSLEEEFDQEEKALQLKKTYYEKFKSALPVSKIAKLEQTEKEFKLEVLRTIKERRRAR
ncbi:MAG: hypothetical protein HOP11_03225 [Saprospiraceae bacterium]|nr:hypothetical protein [Saprospiraceae bacterium]